MPSRINVNQITSSSDGPVNLNSGITIPSGKQFSIQGNVNVTGVLTATSFTGDGSGLTGLPTITTSKVFAYKRILGFDEYRSTSG